MSETLDIGSYLRQQAQHGEVDSQGEFTVSHQQAAQKLARFSLPRPTAWVTKLIQVSVRWKARSVKVSQSLTETVFHFQLDSVPPEEDIVAAIVSGSVDRGRPLDGLALALRALVEQAGLSFLLTADNGARIPRPIYAGWHYGRLTEKNRLHHLCHFRPGLSVFVRHNPGHMARYDPERVWETWRCRKLIFQELQHGCFACPVPILGVQEAGRRPHGSAALGLSSSGRLH